MNLLISDLFPCNQCGLCCKNISHIKELETFDRGDGSCKYLKDNLCSIYESRPLICRIDEMFNTYFLHIYTKKEYIEININACQSLQMNAGLPPEKQLKVKGERN